MPPPSMLEICRLAPVVPVIVIHSIEDAAPMAEALTGGGLPALEVTLRTPVALEAIAEMRVRAPQAVIGAGTVLSERDARAAQAAGAQFLVSPGLTDALADAVAETGLPFLPGVATASEAMRAAERGFQALKLFPAENVGGRGLLKSLSGPLPDIRFCPTGGVGPSNAGDYLALPNVVCVGGSWVAPADRVAAKDWAGVAALAAEAAGLRG